MTTCNIDDDTLTKYHRLYKYPHRCSRIQNLTKHNGKKLFISGDSQFIPIIPILACYYKEVWYMDNRTGHDPLMKYVWHHYTDKYASIEFDQAIVQLFDSYINKYTNENFL